MNNPDEGASVEKLIDEGLTCYGLGMFDEAALRWSKALEIAPNHPLAIEYLDLVKEDLGGDISSDSREPESPVKMGKSPSATSDEKERQSAEGKERGVQLMIENRFEDAINEIRRAMEGEIDAELRGYELLARTHLLIKCSEIIGDFNASPRVVMKMDEIKDQKLSKEGGFILSLVDGAISYDDILSLARMDRLDAIVCLSTLIEKGIIRT